MQHVSLRLTLGALTVALSLHTFTLHAQSGWYWQNPLPQGNGLFGVSFTEANTGTAVGMNGTIIRTTDGGSTWTVQTSGTTNILYGVSFIDANKGIAVGESGRILRTTNGGVFWTTQTSGTANDLRSVSVTDANTATAVGKNGTILRTADGGSSWVSQSSGATNDLYGVAFTDANTGTAVGDNGIILRTTNGGSDWISQSSGTTSTLWGVSFVDANTGTAVGNSGTILRTTDGGSNWNPQSSGTTTNDFLGVHFLNANTGTMVGSWGSIFSTTDGGETWSNQSVQTESLWGVSFADANTGTVVGLMGEILRTTNGGSSWVSQSSGTRKTLNGVFFVDANTGTAVGNSGTILRTTDGGSSWIAQSSGTTESLFGVSFTDANTGTAVGSWGTILHTTNGGGTWEMQTSGVNWQLRAVSFADASTGTAVGIAGVNGGVLRTTNGGTTWTVQDPGMVDQLYGVWMTDANTAVVVGGWGAGVIRRTTNGGTTWTTPTSESLNPLYGVSFTDNNTGMAVGSSGATYRTTDGGASWTTQWAGTYDFLFGVSMADANTATVVGGNGIILRTTDGGTTWTSQGSGTFLSLNAVSFTDANTGSAVGMDGVILRTTTGGEIVTPPTAPALASPSDGATGVSTSPTLSWNPSTGASTYRLQLSTSSDFVATVIDQSGIATTNYAVSIALEHNREYYWRVNANNAAGTSSYSSTWSFTTVSVPAPNNAALFDGVGSRIRVLDGSPVNPNANKNAYQISGASITVEAWVYPLSFPEPESGNPIVTRPLNPPNDPYENYALWVYHGNGFPQAAFSISSGSPGSREVVLCNDALQTFQWTHLAGTYDGIELKIYVNGNLKGQEAVSLSIGTNGVGLYIGRFLTNRFRGVIDDVRLWNVPRTESEIQNSMSLELTGSETGLAGYWKLNSTALVNNVLVVPDLTVNHNDLPVEGRTPIIPFNPIDLSGSPTISISPLSLDYGVFEVGESVARPVTITNNGTATLVGFASNAVFFAPAGESSEVNIPAPLQQSGQLSSSLFVYSNAPSSPSMRGVSGTVLQQTAFDLNNIRMHISRNGRTARDFLTNSAGFEWPKGSGKTAIYQTGLWLGAQVNSSPYVAASSYNPGFQAGPAPGGVPVNPSDTKYRVYKISRGDNSSSNPDFAEWPADLGAPVNTDGTPRLLGDQTLFAVYNAYPVSGWWATGPLGAEVQQLVYGHSGSTALNNTVFIRCKIINRSNQPWVDARATLWADVDLGNHVDDLVACDPGRNLGIIYNSPGADAVYGPTPPAVGLLYLKGTTTAAPLGSFAYFAAGTPITDPTSAGQAYNYMRGLKSNGTPFIDPTNNQPTLYPLNGDPVANSGWVDSGPGDRRMMINSESFDLEPGESTVVEFAIVVGQGTSNLNSVADLRNDVDAVSTFFQNAPQNIYTVTNTNDNGVGSLRDAIEQANAHAGYDGIEFNISGTPPFTIQPLSPLPTITDPVIIDGTSQPGFSGTPIVELDGSSAGPASGLNMQSDGCTVGGLVINRFQASGISIIGTNNLVRGNYIGTDVSGTVDWGNQCGVSVVAGSNTIGGTDVGEGNIISGNDLYGVILYADATHNLVQGNFIGTDVTGTVDLGNNLDGVRIAFGSGNIVGGTTAAARNLISGNNQNGVIITGSSASNNFVQGNYIGTAHTGTAAVPNRFGVFIQDAPGNAIGGTNTADRNIISGNTDDGINILGASATGNVVAGNYVGIAADGASALGNGDDGINIESPDNTIGGTTPGAGNVFSANGSHGIVIVGSSATGNRVMGNYVGTDKDGVIDQGNNEGGIFIGNGASGNIIGGTTQEERNIISANGVNPPPDFPSGIHGVVITGSGTTGNVVIGNHIGTDVSGATALGNGGDGIQIRNGALANRIGGTNPGERNIISGNDVTGVAIFGSGTTGNSVLGNYIGLDATGRANIGHVDGTGVYIGMMASNNMVGGTVSGARNFISGNIGWAGVAIDGANNNTIVGNSIGTDIHGTASFGNLIGVRIYNGASGNKIGGTAVGEGNLIAYSAEEGVMVSEAGSINNAILSNSIHSNSALGIDLRPGDESANAPPNVTANDAGDGDAGPNNLQNYPVLSSAKFDRGRITVTGTLNSTARTNFTLQFFANSSRDPSEYGEGELLIGSIKVTTGESGSATFSEVMTGSAPAGSYITATATDPNNNTSEFSHALRLASPDVVVPAGYVSEIIASNLSQPQGMAFDGSGNLFVAASGSGEIVRISSSGVSVVATNFSQPIDVTFDGASTLYVSDLNRNGVFAINLAEPLPVNASELIPLVGGLDGPTYLRLMSGGQLLVSVLRGTTQDRIVRINLTGPIVSDYVTFFQSNHNPEAMIFDANGDLLIALQALGEVRKATLNPPPLFLPIDGRNLPTLLKGLDSPTGIVIGGDGRLYIATRYDIDVSKPGSNTWTPFLTGLSGSLFNNVIVGPAGQLYIADRDGGRIIRVGAPQIQIVATGSFPLPYMINEKGEPTITDNSVFTAIHNAFRHWQDVGTSTAAFQNAGTTSETNASALDEVNLVTFSDQEFLFPPGVLAVAAKTIELDAGSQTAKIVDADIVFNPYWIGNTSYRYGTDTRPGAFDIESIATHEIGHILGLVHSGVLDATMFFVLQKGTDARTLETDDHAWVGQQYPAASFSSSFGSIAGTIRYGYDNQTLVAGALVRATNSTTGKAVHSYSTENGAYLIPGLEAGNYKVSMQPLNGDVDGFPMTPAHVSAYVQAITSITDYPKELYSQNETNIDDPAAFSLVSVSAGVKTTGIDIITNIDVTPPTILSVFPASAATGVSIFSEVIVTFSEPVNAATLNDNTFALMGGGTATQGTILFLKNNQVAVFTPTSPLKPSMAYTVQVTTGVTDVRGNSLASAFSSAFTTEAADAIPPAVSQVVPADGAVDVFVTAAVIVRFSEAIDAATVTSTSFAVGSNGNNVAGTIVLTQQNTVATFTPTVPLQEGTAYTVTVTQQVADLSGNTLAAVYSSTFTTAQHAPPSVVQVGPDAGATDISVTSPVLIDFSEPIDRATINTNSVRLTIGGALVAGTFEFLNDDSRVVFRPSAPLEFGSQYQITITTAVKDQSGDPLAQLFTSSFSTAVRLVQPSITSVDPPAGTVERAVVIAGNGFDPDPIKISISFNGVSSVVSSSSLTSITTKVPLGATSGPLTVTVRGVQSNEVQFDVLIPIEDAKNVVVASVDTDTEPRDADVTPDGALAYVTNAKSNTVSVVNLSLVSPSVIASIPVGQTPLKIAINPQGTLAYVSNFASNSVSVIDITGNDVITTIPVGVNPIGVAVTPDGTRIYVANFTSKNLSVIDGDPKSGAFNQVVASVSTDAEPRDVDVSPDGTLAFVATTKAVLILNLDPAAAAPNSVVATVSTDSEPRDITVTPDGTLAVVITSRGTILLIDIYPRSPSFGQVVASSDSDSQPREAEVTPDGTLVYVTNGRTNDVSVYELAYVRGVIGSVTSTAVKLQLRESIPVGNSPQGVVIDARAQRAIVVNSGSNNLSVISISGPQATPALAVAQTIELVQRLLANPSTPTAAKGSLQNAKSNLERAIARMNEGKTLQFFDELNQAVHDLLKAARDGAIVSDIINLIVKTARRLAQDSLNAAKGFAGKKNVDEQIDKAKKEMAAADQAVAAGDFENAITHFRLAWDAAQRAIQLALKGLAFNQEQADATVKETVPTEFALNQNYPNPFNSTTQVSFDIPLRAENGIHVELKVYNLLGQLVNTLVDEIKAPGSYTVLWRGNHYDGRAAASGLYILHIRAGEFRAARKMILLQ